MKNKQNAFTLAEMMVVMFIVSLVAIAMLPVMTVRQKSKSGELVDAPWKYSANKSDIYFGIKDTQGAIIGANALALNEKARLILNTPNTWTMADSHLIFKKNNAATGRLTADSINNIALGKDALIKNTTGFNNTANGVFAMSTSSTGNQNAAFGYAALQFNTTGSSNTASGAGALMKSSTGFWNTAHGSCALYLNETGYSNTAVGSSALYYNTTGWYNTANGANTLMTNTTGSFNTGIGFQADVKSSALSYATAIGAYSAVSSSNSVVLGRATDSVYAGSAGLLMASDKRLKNIKGLNNSGLDELRKINVYDYTLKTDKEKKNHVGVIAQDVQKVFPKAVGINADTLYVNYNDLNMAMLNAVKELDKMVQDLKAKILSILNTQSIQDKRIKELEAKNKSLEARILKLERK